MAFRTCLICRNAIDRKDNYCRLTDYHKGKQFKEGFYHTDCFNEQIRGRKAEEIYIKKMAMATLINANKALGKFSKEIQ